jgi:hypothetical protein
MSIIFKLVIATNPMKAMLNVDYKDSILHYKNGKDSIRVTYKGNKMYKRLTYYPNGKLESMTTIIKDKEYHTGRCEARNNINLYLLDRRRKNFK